MLAFNGHIAWTSFYPPSYPEIIAEYGVAAVFRIKCLQIIISLVLIVRINFDYQIIMNDCQDVVRYS